MLDRVKEIQNIVLTVESARFHVLRNAQAKFLDIECEYFNLSNRRRSIFAATHNIECVVDKLFRKMGEMHRLLEGICSERIAVPEEVAPESFPSLKDFPQLRLALHQHPPDLEAPQGEPFPRIEVPSDIHKKVEESAKS